MDPTDPVYTARLRIPHFSLSIFFFFHYQSQTRLPTSILAPPTPESCIDSLDM